MSWQPFHTAATSSVTSGDPFSICLKSTSVVNSDYVNLAWESESSAPSQFHKNMHLGLLNQMTCFKKIFKDTRPSLSHFRYILKAQQTYLWQRNVQFGMFGTFQGVLVPGLQLNQ